MDVMERVDQEIINKFAFAVPGDDVYGKGSSLCCVYIRHDPEFGCSPIGDMERLDIPWDELPDGLACHIISQDHTFYHKIPNPTKAMTHTFLAIWRI